MQNLWVLVSIFGTMIFCIGLLAAVIQRFRDSSNKLKSAIWVIPSILLLFTCLAAMPVGFVYRNSMMSNIEVSISIGNEKLQVGDNSNITIAVFNNNPQEIALTSFCLETLP